MRRRQLLLLATGPRSCVKVLRSRVAGLLSLSYTSRLRKLASRLIGGSLFCICPHA